MKRKKSMQHSYNTNKIKPEINEENCQKIADQSRKEKEKFYNEKAKFVPIILFLIFLVLGININISKNWKFKNFQTMLLLKAAGILMQLCNC